MSETTDQPKDERSGSTVCVIFIDDPTKDEPTKLYQDMLKQPQIDLNTLSDISEALNSDNRDQVNIAQYGISWLNLLLAKNRDYGSSAFKVPILAPDLPPESAIRVRMSDKIERLKNLLKNPESQAVDESIDDTLGDLSSYGLLLLIVRKANARIHADMLLRGASNDNQHDTKDM